MGGCLFWWVGGLVGGLVGRNMWNHKNFNKTWSNRDNSILFEDLWFVDTLPPLDRCMGGWLGGWVGQWVSSRQIIKNWVNCHLIEIIEFCLKIYDVWTHSHLWIGVWVGGWVGQWVGSCQIIKNRVNCHLIEIIEFCLKIYDLWAHSHLWIGVWVGGWVDGWVSGSVHVKLLKIK